MSELRYVIDICGLEEGIRCAICENPMHTDKGCDGNCKYNEKAFKRITDLLDKRIELLPIAPEPHWIPVKEKNPIEYDNPIEFLVTLEDPSGERYIELLMWDGYEWDEIYTDDNELGIWGQDEVIAWCKPLEPYKGVTE